MTTHHHISIIWAAAALALGISAVPAAAIPFHIASPAIAPSIAARQSPGHLNHTDQASSPVSCGDVCSGHGYARVSEPSRAPDESGATLPHDPRPRPLPSYLTAATARIPPASVRVVAPGGGFDWGDAGIGAAGSLGLTLLALGSVMTVSQRRTRRGQTAVTS